MKRLPFLTRSILVLHCALTFALILSLSPHGVVAAFGKKSADLQTDLIQLIIELDQPGLVEYTGGTQWKGVAIPATAPPEDQSKSPDFNAPESLLYQEFLNAQQHQFFQEVQSIFPEAQIVAKYQAAMNGMAIELRSGVEDQIRGLPGVKNVWISGYSELQTFQSPTTIHTQVGWQALGGQSEAGEGVVIGVIDSGIWSPNLSSPYVQQKQLNPSFKSDASVMGGAYTFPFVSVSGRAFNTKLGVCHPSIPQANDGSFACNDKVIGGYFYRAGPHDVPGEFNSPLDIEAHGSHVAGVAAGNPGVQVNIPGQFQGTITGIAPRARIIAYKVCWVGDPNNPVKLCAGTDIISAINQAILDGVNIINYSLSGQLDPRTDPVSQAFLRAHKIGIFIAASGSIDPVTRQSAHNAPWVNFVASSRDNRLIVSEFKITSSGGQVPPVGIKAATTVYSFQGLLRLAPSQRAGDSYPSSCDTAYPAGTFKSNELVICRRGTSAILTKLDNVKSGGAANMILINQPPPTQPQEIYSQHYFMLPSAATSYSAAGENLVNYLKALPTGTTVSITTGSPTPVTLGKEIIVTGSFQSNTSYNILKPDNAAPGDGILSAFVPQMWINKEVDGRYFAFLSGTSMATPHVAGAAALLKSLYPQWTPSEIQSALSTSAVLINRSFPESTATPSDQGSGRIDVGRSISPGLVFSIPNSDMDAFNLGIKLSETLNRPSMMQHKCPAISATQLRCSWTRTAKSVLPTAATFTWRVENASPGLNVALNQASYTIQPGQSVPFTVTATTSANTPQNQYASAYLVLVSATPNVEVRLPVVVYVPYRNKMYLPLLRK